MSKEGFHTRREKIAELINKNDLSPSEIARIIGFPEKIVIEDLRHIAKSSKYGKMLILPAKCRNCGYVFPAEVKVPKRCPKCKSMWIEEPRFKIQKV